MAEMVDTKLHLKSVFGSLYNNRKIKKKKMKVEDAKRREEVIETVRELIINVTEF
jgi:hypothetical protein